MSESKSEEQEGESEASEPVKEERSSEAAARSDSEGAPAEAAPPAAKKKKKKKKRKLDAAGEGSSSEAPSFDVTGAERAAFLAWFPADPELDVLVRAFEVGNYALIRERAGKLAESSEDEKVRAAARELLIRIEPDPLMKYLLAGAILLLLFLTFYAYSHAH